MIDKWSSLYRCRWPYGYLSDFQERWPRFLGKLTLTIGAASHPLRRL